MFEPNFEEKIKNLNNSLDSHFDVMKCQLVTVKSENNPDEEHLVICKNVQSSNRGWVISLNRSSTH